MWGISSVVGPTLGGVFSEYVSWRWIFWVNIPLCLIAAATIGLRFTERLERRRPRIDYAGAGVLTVALTLLILLRRLARTLASLAGLIALAGLRALLPALALALALQLAFALLILLAVRIGILTHLTMTGAVAAALTILVHGIISCEYPRTGMGH